MIEKILLDYLSDALPVPCYVSMPAISSCERNTDYNFPDTTRRLPRYQAVFDLVYYD